MAGTATPIYPQTIKNAAVQFAPGDTTTAKTVIAGGTNGTKIESLLAYSSDTADRDIVVSVLISAVTYNLTTMKLPLTSGNVDTVPCLDILKNAQFPGLATDAMGNKYLYLASGTTLQIAMGSTITTAKVVNIFAQGGDY